MVADEVLMTKTVGTTLYRAPEINGNNEHYSNKCDIFSVSYLIIISLESFFLRW